MSSKLSNEKATLLLDEARRLIAFGESRADAALDPVELAAYTMAVNQLMNLDEVLNK